MGGVKDDVMDQFTRLRALTRVTWMLYDAQVVQLRRWPFLVDSWVAHDGVEIAVDFEGKRLVYRWTSEAASGPLSSLAEYRRKVVRGGAGYAKKMTLLTDWIRHLLGDDWSVSVELDGKPVFNNEGGEIQDGRPDPGPRPDTAGG